MFKMNLNNKSVTIETVVDKIFSCAIQRANFFHLLVSNKINDHILSYLVLSNLSEISVT